MKATTVLGVRPRIQELSKAIADVLRGTSVLAVSGGAILGAALAVAPATRVVAQDEDQEVSDEITVTGSRIVRQDFTANSPIQTVDEQMFEQTSAVGVETVLNRLPQFVPAVTQFSTGDVQQTATNTVGASTVSLRGLGPNRNLVLINGRRAMPINPTMVVDTNSIPATAIQRVEVISGGASAVYGADAVGGVVNFILKDDYEGASIDVRLGDTEHGGDQTVTFAALLGVNAADDRGNIMLGIERDTRTKQYTWERDWRLADFANPNVQGGGFAFGSATWWHNEPTANTGPVPPNNPTQAAVDALFPPATGACPHPNTYNPTNNSGPPFFIPVTVDDDPNNLCRISNSLGFGGTNFRTNRDGTVFTGLTDASGGFFSNPLQAPGAYRFNGPVYNGNPPLYPNAGSGDLDGDFQGLPVFVRQPNGAIKENIMYQWASIPLERLSAFGNGHFDLSDNLRVTGQAMYTRTETETSLGLASANINQWGAGIPFGNTLYRGNSNTYFDIPDSLCTAVGPGCSAVGVTNASYTPTGRYGVNCDAPLGTPGMPQADGLPGCTNSEAWPVPPEVYTLMMTRPFPNNTLWASREPDWMRSVLGAGRSSSNVTTTMSLAVGLEGDLPSGSHSWDMSLYTGRSDNTVEQLGSVRLTTYRDILTSPNFGRNATFDPNPWESAGFAESIPTCTSGLPIADNRGVTADCVQMVAPRLKNLQNVDQTIFEFNLVGDLAEMPAGALQYALGAGYRENSFEYVPDNLSDVQNEVDPIAGLFPTERSAGEFDVTEIYGELLIPIVSDGPTGVEHFNIELGGRVSDWSMEQMPNLETWKALIDWGITSRYRLRGGFNRAFRAPNLGELYLRRTQIFGFAGASRDWCSQNLSDPGTFSATPPTGKGTASTPQTDRTLLMCQQLMGPQGTTAYYGQGLAAQPDLFSTVGLPISFGNPQLREEQADTFTMGLAMELFDDWRLTVDYWHIEIDGMIAAESADATYQRCMDLAFNPTGDMNAEACQQIFRSPTSGQGAYVLRTFNNEGRSDFGGVDFQLNWSHQFSGGGGLNLNTSLTYNLHEITQERSDLAENDWAGFSGMGNCALQLQCLNYEYRVFSNVGYGRGMWDVNFTHQYWPETPNLACRTNPISTACLYSSQPDYQLFSAAANLRFADRYRVSIGIENLLDEEPPCTGANPTQTPFPTECSRTQGPGGFDGGTYDPLGRRYFISMNMEF
jgi:outer membrane receptor protein involved in Fe transport